MTNKKLTVAERQDAAQKLEEVLAQIGRGQLDATEGERSYIAAAISGLEGRV